MSFEADVQSVFGTQACPRFSMYTKKGDKMVADVVARAKRNYWNWEQTRAALEQLARNHADVAGEATDTAVRECVYFYMGFDA